MSWYSIRHFNHQIVSVGCLIVKQCGVIDTNVKSTIAIWATIKNKCTILKETGEDTHTHTHTLVIPDNCTSKC